MNLNKIMESTLKIKLMSDVDGVLVDFNGDFADWLEENHNDAFQGFNPAVWDFNLGKESWNYIKEFWSSGVLTNLTIFPNAKKVFNDLSEIFQMNIVTALDPKYKSERVINLKGFKYDSIKVLGTGKIEYILNNLKPVVAIEDKPEYIRRMSKAGIDVYFPRIPMTRGLESYGTPYRNWLELKKILLEKYGN